jgi:hypothetical protein
LRNSFWFFVLKTAVKVAGEAWLPAFDMSEPDPSLVWTHNLPLLLVKGVFVKGFVVIGFWPLSQGFVSK